MFRIDRQTGQILRVSVATDGSQGNSPSYDQSMSADGRYIVFISDADNLVVNDTNSRSDAFVKDMQTGIITKVSTDSNGVEGVAYASWPSISADGRYVTFASDSTNLVTGDTNMATDIFVKDMQTDITIRVSTDSSGAEAGSGSNSPSISADGRYVVFSSGADNLVVNDTNTADDIFLKDTLTGVLTIVSTSSTGLPSNAGAYVPSISPDGRYLVFNSTADNLVFGDSNNQEDVFRKDLLSGETILVSTSAEGLAGNSGSYGATISNDGRYVVFTSNAENLVSGDANNRNDVFRKDLLSGETLRLGIPDNGGDPDDGAFTPYITSDGRFVAFYSQANNIDYLVPGTSEGVVFVEFNLDEVVDVSTDKLASTDNLASTGQNITAMILLAVTSIITPALVLSRKFKN